MMFVSFDSNPTGATCEAGTAYHSVANQQIIQISYYFLIELCSKNINYIEIKIEDTREVNRNR
jgi:hypothetical protein